MDPADPSLREASVNDPSRYALFAGSVKGGWSNRVRFTTVKRSIKDGRRNRYVARTRLTKSGKTACPGKGGGLGEEVQISSPLSHNLS